MGGWGNSGAILGARYGGGWGGEGEGKGEGKEQQETATLTGRGGMSWGACVRPGLLKRMSNRGPGRSAQLINARRDGCWRHGAASLGQRQWRSINGAERGRRGGDRRGTGKEGIWHTCDCLNLYQRAGRGRQGNQSDRDNKMVVSCVLHTWGTRWGWGWGGGAGPAPVAWPDRARRVSKVVQRTASARLARRLLLLLPLLRSGQRAPRPLRCCCARLAVWLVDGCQGGVPEGQPQHLI